MNDIDSLAITINVQNNQSYPQNINVMGSIINLLDTANAVTEYAWDITAFTFTNENKLTLQYKANQASSYSYFTASLAAQTAQGIVDALNTLNIGYFYTYVKSGTTLISTYNDNYTFTTLNIYAASLINPIFQIGTGFSQAPLASVTLNGGNLLAVGFGNSYNGVTVNNIVLLNPDGSINAGFVSGTGFDNGVNAVAVQPDGKIVVGGLFTNYNGTPANKIIRLNPDGSVDTSFLYGTGFNGGVNAILIQPDGSIIIGGQFSNYNGTIAQKIISLNSNGSVNLSFVYGTGFGSSVVYTLFAANDNAFFVGGLFTSYNGTNCNYIVKLLNNGAIDTAFNYGSGFGGGSSIYALSYNPLTSLLTVGGIMTSYQGTTISNIVQLNSNGTINTAFATGSGFNTTGGLVGNYNGGVINIQQQTDNKLIIGGGFTIYNGTTVLNIVRLNQNGTLDTTWNYGGGFSSTVVTISPANNGTIYAAGLFTSFNGTALRAVASLYN